MGYVDDNLISGEKVTYRASLHWKAFLAPVLGSVVLVALALAALAKGWTDPQGSTVFLILSVLLVVVAAILIIKVWITTASAEFAVTNKRVILKTGFIQKKTAEMFLAKIESVGVDQSILGRILGYGSIVIRGTGGSLEPFSDLSQPLEFRRQIQEQIGQSLESRGGRGLTESGDNALRDRR